MHRLALVVTLLCPLAAAQEESYARDLIAAAREQGPARAHESLRAAALLADRMAAEELRCRCLLDLAALHARKDWPEARGAAVVPLLRAAARAAARAGRLDLETRALRGMVAAGEDNRAELLDAAVAARDVATIEWMWERADDKKSLDLAMDLIDGQAHAAWLVGTRAEAMTVPLLQHLLKRAREAGLERTVAVLLEQAAKRTPAHWEEVLERARKRGDGRAEARALLALRRDRKGALKKAQRARDLPLQLEILEALGEKKLAAQTERRLRADLLDRAERATRHPGLLDDALLARLNERADDPEFARLLVLLEDDPPAAASTEGAAAYAKALADAMAEEKSQLGAATLAELAGRPEAFAPLVAALDEKSVYWSHILAVEGLAMRAHRKQLLELLDHPLAGVREAAGAALLRLGVDELGMATVVALSSQRFKNDVSRIYLKGAIAKDGNPNGFFALKADAQSKDKAVRLHAAGVLASLGFASPVRTLHELTRKDVDAKAKARVLGRMPRSWGATLIYDLQEDAPSEAARAAALRGDRERRSRLAKAGGVTAYLWKLPRTPREAAACAVDDVGVLRAGTEVKSERRHLFEWAGENAGISNAEIEAALGSEGGKSDERVEARSPLRELARAERRTRRARAGGSRRDLLLLDFDPDGYARCHIRAQVGRAELQDNQLRVPFRWRHKIQAVGTGGFLAGPFYKNYTMAFAEGDLWRGVRIFIPGHEPIEAAVRGGKIVATLPYESTGEGLGDNRTIPVEKLVRGRIQVRFDFNGNRGGLSFPLAYVAPTKAKKPDLVPVDLVVEPPAPGIGEEADITVRVANKGRSVTAGAILSVRFQVNNPQGDGWRTVDARVLDAAGWRAGEARTFHVRPKFVRDYYMNKYSHTWTPAVGDSVLAVVVDPDGALEEEDEDNNRLELEVPLDLPEAEGKKLAEAELLAALKAPLRRLAAANDFDELDRAYGEAAGLLESAKFRSADLEAANRHVLAIYQLRVFRIRTGKAMARLRAAEEAGRLDRNILTSVQGDLARAKRSLLRSGVPIKLETINVARNHALAAANLATAHAEYGDLAPLLGDGEVDTGPAGEVGRTLKALDGALVAWRYARERAEGKEADIGDMMDAASNFADAADVKLPGFSNLHKALLKAELDYVDKGMRKNASALEAVSAMIAQEEGAQRRLDAAVRDVEGHVRAGPFTKEALGDIAKGWAKDIPILGQILDVVWSAR